MESKDTAIDSLMMHISISGTSKTFNKYDLLPPACTVKVNIERQGYIKTNNSPQRSLSSNCHIAGHDDI